MPDYPTQVYTVIAGWFGNWIIDKIFFPAFLAILTGYFVSNVILFRDQWRRAVEEMTFLRRRMEYGRDTHQFARAIGDWDANLATCTDELEQIEREMSYCGFQTSSKILFTVIEAVRRNMVDITVDTYRTARNMWHAEGTNDPAKLDDRYSMLIRYELRKYWTNEHLKLRGQVSAMRPCFFELIDVPSFYRFKTIAAELKAPFVRIAAWIDGKYAPKRSDCATCCNNCNRTI